MGKRRAERPRWGQRHWVVALSLLTLVFLVVIVVLKIVVDRDEAPSRSSAPMTAVGPERSSHRAGDRA